MLLAESDMKSERSEGFTLLELMLTMTLLAVVTLIVASALRIGTRAWEKGTRKVTAIQSPRTVLDAFKHQLRSALPHQLVWDGETVFLFSGESKQIQFVSVSSLYRQMNGGAFLVTYRVSEAPEGEAVSITEENLAKIDWADRLQMSTDEEGRTLVDGAGSFSFEYAKDPAQDEALIWETRWDSREKGGLPAAVKLIYETDTDPGRYEAVVRFPVESIWAAISQ